MPALRLLGALALALGTALLASPAFAESGPCSGVMPKPGKIAVGQRPLVAGDLIRLRDIGAHDRTFPDAGSIALSPDGDKVAFQVRQAVPEINGYCLAMVVKPIRPGAGAIVVDQGGELIRATYDFRGKLGFPTGIPLPIAPRWSPDGTWIAFLKRIGPTTQVWRANPSEDQSAAITRSAFDVEDFRISADGQTILFSTRPALSRARQQIETEGLSGFHYDDRYSPMSSSRPFPVPPIDREIWAQAVGSSVVRQATAAEAALFADVTGSPDGAIAVARGPGGRKAWILQSENEMIASQVRLFADGADGSPILCRDDICRAQIGKLWWTKDGSRLRFFRREGWSNETNAIYEWRPGHGRPRKLYQTIDILADCLPRDDALLCLRESATQPRRIISLNLSSNSSTVEFDPNPEFASLHLGRVERLRWRNSFGLETYGDIVFPVGYRPGRLYPLIVVQYESRGFLRGGTGDEYPIQAFANRGYMVLSFNRPQMIGIARGRGSVVEVERENLVDFAERRSILSSVETGVAQLVARGIVDKDRVGITGLSDGTATVQFALANGARFAAAAVSSSPWDPSYPALVGPFAARQYASHGFPRLTEQNPGFWNRISLSRNARAIKTPLLMQLADDEYLAGLESLTALRETGASVDMFIYPDEHHVKWQPAHRLSVYKRNLDWFDYWLRGVCPTLSERGSELLYWDDLRAESLRRLVK